MSVKSLAAWIAIFAPIGASAAPALPAPHCVEARISSLQFEEKNGSVGADFCKADVLTLPAAARSVLAQVRTLNTNVAAVFEMSAHQLFATPFALRIKKSVRGPLVSFAQNESSERGGRTTRLTMGVYPDWTGDEPLNPGVYTHELGHVIGLLPYNAALPPLYRKLTSTKLMLEMMADFTAFNVAGAIFSPEIGIPACLQQAFRVVTPELSYTAPIDLFMHERSWRRTDACCLLLERTQGHTTRSRDFCAEHLKNGETPSATEFGDQPFNADFYDLHDHEIDGHLVGLPLNSFLLDLSRQTGLEMAPRLLHAMQEAEHAPPRAYVCEIPRLKNFLKPQRQTRHSLAQVFARLERALPESAQPVYRKLWLSHGMDVGAQISEIDARRQADALAFGDGSDAFNLLYSNPPTPPDPRLKKTGCWEAFDADVATPAEPGRLDEERPGCNWVCKLAP